MRDTGSAFTGRYHRAFLNGLVGYGNYTIKSMSLSALSQPAGLDLALETVADPELSLAYMSDEKLTCVWIHDYPGWLTFCDAFGISIRYSPKIAKRLTAMTRLTYLSTFRDLNDFNAMAVEGDEFSSYDFGDGRNARFLDGANVMSTELLEEMMTNGSEHVSPTSGHVNPWQKDIVNRAIDRAGSFSVRFYTPDGLVKGDCFAVPRKFLPSGCDLLYSVDNLKTEVLCRDFVFALAEPHPGNKRHGIGTREVAPPPAWSDDQSMSWLGEWLFPKDQLIEAMGDYAYKLTADLEQSRIPSFFVNTKKLDDKRSSVGHFQSMTLQWERNGLGIEQSIFLTERIAQGTMNKLRPIAPDGVSHRNRRWPMMCAMYVHVATDSWLHMAGYYDPETGSHPWPGEEPKTPEGSVWYHEPTGRMVYNDADFANLYDRHGGWDLDDTIHAYARRYPDGTKVWVTLRSPNSYGEYDVKRYIEGTFAPVWERKDGTSVEFPPIEFPVIPFIEDLGINYANENLKPDHDVEISDDYTRGVLAQAVEMAVKFKGLFGRRANADMAYFATNNDYRRDQLAPMEAMVDACTQEQSETAYVLINQDVEDVLSEMISYRGEHENPFGRKVVDTTIWNDRVRRRVPIDRVVTRDLKWTSLCSAHDTLCDVYVARMKKVAQSRIDNIDPDLLTLGKRFADAGQTRVDWFWRLNNELPRPEGQTSTQFYVEVGERMAQDMLTYTELQQYHLVLGMAYVCYTTKRGDGYSDNPLFQQCQTNIPSVFDIYCNAINYYGIGDPTWQVSQTCTICNVSTSTSDRLHHQEFLVSGRRCPTC